MNSRRLGLLTALSIALLSFPARAQTIVQPNGPAVTIMPGKTVTTSGSINVIGITSAEVELIYNVTGTVSGTLPTLAFTVSATDPQNSSTTIAGDCSVSSASISTSGSKGVVLCQQLRSSSVKISWTVGGTLPSFGAVNATLAIKSAISQ